MTTRPRTKQSKAWVRLAAKPLGPMRITFNRPSSPKRERPQYGEGNTLGEMLFRVLKEGA